MTHGRIYKIQRIGTKNTPPGDLGKMSSKELVELLKNNNPWWHRTALRLLHERRDRSVVPLLKEMVFRSKNEVYSLRGLWGLYAVGALDENLAHGAMLEHEGGPIASWTIRLLGESGRVPGSVLRAAEFLLQLGQLPAPLHEEMSALRLQLACTAQRLNHPDIMPLLHSLMEHKQDVNDPCIPLMLWLAYEPRLAASPIPEVIWLRKNAPGNPLITEEILPRVMRRLVATGKPKDLAAALALLEIRDSTVRRRALQGLLQGMEPLNLPEPPERWAPVFRVLSQDAEREVQRLARRLAVKFHDLQAIHQALAIARDKKAPLTERIEAVHDLAGAHPATALQPLKEILRQETDNDLGAEVCRTLAAYNDKDIPKSVIAGWKRYSPTVRVEAIGLLAGRKEWARELLAAVGRNDVPRTDLNNNTILRIRAFRDGSLNAQIAAVWGRVRESTPAELNALIDRMRTSLAKGRGSMERGRKIFENQCAKCHKFDGKGHEVGPNLDGAARDIEYLLVNILDPNRVVGQPYYTRYVEMKDGRVETGLLQAEDKQSMTLKTENDVLKVLLKKDIGAVSVQEKSLMPEGLNKNISEQDFRDLIRYVMANPFLTEVEVAGPFDSKDHVRIQPQEQPPGKTLTWTQPVVGPPGRITLPASKGEGESLAYVLAQVTAPEPTRTRLQLGAAQLLEVWVNGKSVYKGKPTNGAAGPDQAGVDVQLRKGVNMLLFAVQYRGAKEALFARLLDPQRKLEYPESRP
jgi:putative heme-binding domain-containing protein